MSVINYVFNKVLFPPTVVMDCAQFDQETFIFVLLNFQTGKNFFLKTHLNFDPHVLCAKPINFNSFYCVLLYIIDITKP